MTNGTGRRPQFFGKKLQIGLLVTFAGAAALSWESIWQHASTLALGVSARGTAITLAATMGGMTGGALAAGRVLRGRSVGHSLRLYGCLELAIGLSGLLLQQGFRWIERLDSAVYAASPGLAPLVHVLGITLVVGPAALAMGATIPVLGLVARAIGGSLAVLYALNTAGAATGVLVMAFWLVPTLGITATTWVVASLNLTICVVAWLLPPLPRVAPETAQEHAGNGATRLAMPTALLVVWTTGFATFVLEVAWFRAFRVAFLSTMDSFAVMLASTLAALAIGARLAPILRRHVGLGPILAVAGVAILLSTPVVERFDLIPTLPAAYALILGQYLLRALLVTGPGILLLGVALPWLLDQQTTTSGWGRLYGVNTLGAILGALGAAWLLLPAVGFARTSWIAGGMVAILGVVLDRGRSRSILAAVAAGALVAAIATESGLGRQRVQTHGRTVSYEILGYDEGPDATVSAIELDEGYRSLVIDGFQAASEMHTAHYMAWMGRLPMLLHPDPRDALVIAFGTGQTANGVRRESPGQLDIVELSPAVIGMAPFFGSNEDVLADSRVRLQLMDGRAWLRRTERKYDVVTLEPMPPHFAGVNALYSVEFYEIMARRLKPGAVVAQWIPFHLVPPGESASIAQSFRAVFPASILWVDPVGTTGILLGRHGTDPVEFGTRWPGLSRPANGRNMTPQKILEGVKLNVEQLSRYAAMGKLITDDNQLLALPAVRRRQRLLGEQITRANVNVIAYVRSGGGQAAPGGEAPARGGRPGRNSDPG